MSGIEVTRAFSSRLRRFAMGLVLGEQEVTEMGGFIGGHFTTRQYRRFQRRQRPIEDLNLVHLSFLETKIPHALTDGQVRLPISDVFPKVIPDHFDFSLPTIQIHLQTGSPTGAIVGEAHVSPTPNRGLLSGLHLQGVAGPHVMQPHGDLPVFEQDLIPATAGIHPGRAVMDHGLSGHMHGRTNPQAEGKRISPGKVPDARH